MSYQSLDDQVIFEKNDSAKEGSNQTKNARIGVFLVISLIFVATASLVIYSDQNLYNKNLSSFFSFQTIPGDNIHSQDALSILSKSGLDSAEKQIQGDVTFEDLNSIDLQPQETQLNEVSSDTPEDNSPPSYLCSLDDPDQDESLNCEHKATSIFMKASQDGVWPRGFSWALLSDFSASDGGLAVSHSEKGAFRQNQNLVCDEYVKKMCINGDYILYASSEDSSLDSDLFVDVCEHSYQIKPGQAVKFNVERGVCSSGEIIPDSKFESLSLLEHVSQFDAQENVNNKIDNQEAVPVKLSDREITRKKQQLASLTKKIKLAEDRVNYDSDKIKYDQGQLKRFKDDVKIEEELLEIFNRKVDKVKQNLDEDQEKLVKDEKNVELIKYQKNQLEQNINDPYVPKDGEAGDDEEDEDEDQNGEDKEDEDKDEDEDEEGKDKDGEDEDEDEDEADEDEADEDEDKEDEDGEAQDQNKDQQSDDQQNSEGQEADDQNKKEDQSGIFPSSSSEDGSSNSSITDDGSAQGSDGSGEGSDGALGGNQTLDGGDGVDGGGQVVETQAQKEERCKNAVIKFICYAEHPKSKPSLSRLRYRL